jgi:hypothetical protein
MLPPAAQRFACNFVRYLPNLALTKRGGSKMANFVLAYQGGSTAETEAEQKEVMTQ